MKRVFSCILLFWVMAFCQQSTNVIKYYEVILPESIDHVFGSEFMACRRCSSLLFRSLYGFNLTRMLVGIIADGNPIPIGDSGKQFSINIKPNMKWHDGQPVTSNDIVRSFQILSNNNTRYSGKELLRKFKNVTADGPQKVIFEMNNKTNSPKDFMIFPILPSHMLAVVSLDPSNNFCREPVGNGPFKILKKEIDRITFQRFDDYSYATPDHKHTNIDRVILEERETTVWVPDLLSGHVDILVEVPLTQVTNLDKHQLVDTKEYPNYEVDMLGFNMRDKNSLLNLRFIREAINRGFDREKAKDVFYRGLADIITGPYPFGSYYYWGNISDYKYDPKEAIKILEENGCKRGVNDIFYFQGKPLSFDLLAIKSLERSLIVTMFIKAMNNIGIEIKDPIYQTLDLYKSYLQMGKFDIAWITPNYRENFDISPSFRSKGGSNYWGYTSTIADDYFDKLASTTDPQIRLYYGHLLHQKIHEDIPCLFLWTKKKFVGFTKKLERIDPHPLDFFLTIDEWRYQSK